jgi:predicted aminopeptidase
MDNLQETDFVQNTRGVKTPKVQKIRYIDTRWCELVVGQEDVRDADHKLLVATRREASEQLLAKSLGRDMHSDSWRASIDRLSSRGYIVHEHQRWDGKKALAMVELPDDERKILLTANGLYFASQSLRQLGVA